MAVLAALVGCADPPVDSNTPTPHGVIEGSVLYIGRRPECDFGPDGNPTQVRGRVLLTLVDNADPLPPEGTAERPKDFFAIGGEDLFTNLGDCMPQNPTDANKAERIQRSVSFRWREIPLASGAGNTVSYRISGFYDQEGDFNPLFAAQNSTSAGDVAGGALQDPTATVTKLQRIPFHSVEDRPLGELVENITVTLAGVVITDPPISHVAAMHGTISAQTTFPVLGLAGYDPFYKAMPSIRLSMYSRNAGADRTLLDRTMTAMNLAGLSDYTNPIVYAWYVKGIDLNEDGNTADTLHPVMGSFGVRWRTPVVFLQRVRNAAETAGGVPSVAFIPFVYPDDATITQRQRDGARYPDIDLGVPPFAAVLLDPHDASCAVQYFADGSNADVINGAAVMGRAFECEEFPTGFYGVNVLQGLVGTPATMVGPQPDTDISNTGFDITGGTFGQQVWRIPNELGLATQVGQDYVVPEQGPAGSVLVYDPDTSNVAGRPENRTAQAGVCDVGPSALGTTPAYTYAAPAAACCEPVAHLCDVPLCPYVTVAATHDGTPRQVRGTPNRTVIDPDDGIADPNCLAFPMPTACCPTTP